MVAGAHESDEEHIRLVNTSGPTSCARLAPYLSIICDQLLQRARNPLLYYYYSWLLTMTMTMPDSRVPQGHTLTFRKSLPLTFQNQTFANSADRAPRTMIQPMVKGTSPFPSATLVYLRG
jgi:hypothetical protein